jgi:hypothetical protein
VKYLIADAIVATLNFVICSTLLIFPGKVVPYSTKAGGGRHRRTAGSSKPGRETVFYVTFPSAGNPQADRREPGEVNTEKLKILVVDDETSFTADENSAATSGRVVS